MTSPRRISALVSVLLLVPLLAVATASGASAAPAGGLFTPLPGLRPSAIAGATVQPKQFRAYQVDLAGVRSQLAGTGPRTISLPAPDGTPLAFTVADDPVLDAAGQAAYPQIQTYSGHGPDNSTVRLDVTPLGFHAMVMRADGIAWYIDPVQDRVGEDRVLSYLGGAVPAPTTPFVENGVEPAHRAAAAGSPAPVSTPGGIVSTRTYRLAMVNDPSYAANFGNTDANVLAAKTSLINRVNEVYNDDLGIHFVLNSSPKLNLSTAALATGANGPCGANACYTDADLAGCADATLTRNDFVLGQLVGADNFDIGHIALGQNSGGLAGLGVVGTSTKAEGCTGVNPPKGDLYAIDYVAHEMGHEMGANHTFNGDLGSCGGGNRNQNPNTTQVEPGSGSSIMAYAGICDTDNLQPHSDPYFSFASIDEINANTSAAPGNENEKQSVTFSGLDPNEQFTLSCSGCPVSPTITYSTLPTYALTLATAVQTVTGQVGTISGYDGGATPSADGFTVTWSGTTANIPTLTVAKVSGTFTSFTGTLVNGGPDANGGAVAATTDHSPVVNAGADKTIPVRTPFTLTGSATDADGDPLTYMWEQTDAGGANATELVSNTKTDGPLFRQFGVAAQVSAANTVLFHSAGENLAGSSPSRTFPDLAQIAAGNTNAATGSCPAAGAAPVAQPIVDCFSEFLPTASWVGNPTSPGVMHFRLTARDEFSADAAADHAGGLSSDDVALTLSPTAGPFLVTSRGTPGTTASGAENVTWNVAGTNTAALAQNVKISLSTDGGLTFPTTLVGSTPNDGSETVVLPSITTSKARIMVSAVGNVFFDMNHADFSITPPAANVAPVVDAGPDATVAAGSAFTSSGSFSDETPATATATVDYGDGAGPQPLTLSGTSFTLNHTYATAGTKTVTVKVTDAGGKSGTDTATVTVTGGVNQPPTVLGPADATVTAGSVYSANGAFVDETPTQDTATVDYGDGSGVKPLTLTGLTFALSHTYAAAGTYTVTIKITDPQGASGTDTVKVTVNANAAPVVNAGPDSTVVLGSPFVSSGSFTDDSPGTPTATVDYGDGAGEQPLTLVGTNFALNHTYAAAGTYTVTVKVTDSGGKSGTDTAKVTVNATNQAPTVIAGPDATVTAGSAYTSNGTFVDETPTQDTATVDYGDGGGAKPLTLTGLTFALSHTYPRAVTSTVTVKITDPGGKAGTDTVKVTVTPTTGNTAPVVNAGPDKSVAINTPFTSTGSFTDESPSTAKATVNYGDGAGAQPLALSGTSFTLNHTYATAGAKTVTVTVTDSAGLSGTDTVSVTVTPSPQLGHLGDGHGRFRSKKESSSAAPRAQGKAKFSFTVDKSGGKPSGHARFKFKRGKVKFKGTNVTTASVSGKTLVMSVEGTNRGKSGYTLLIEAYDGGKRDKIRVLLVRAGSVVYDSMPGAALSKGPKTHVKGVINVV